MIMGRMNAQDLSKQNEEHACEVGSDHIRGEGIVRLNLPTRTLVTSGSSIGSGGGTGAVGSVLLSRKAAENRLNDASFTASLIIDPLKPTSETPTMTVTNDNHLSINANEMSVNPFRM